MSSFLFKSTFWGVGSKTGFTRRYYGKGERVDQERVTKYWREQGSSKGGESQYTATQNESNEVHISKDEMQVTYAWKDHICPREQISLKTTLV